MPYQQAGDVRLYYEEQGSGPETILFVHGYSGGSVRWQPIIERLPGSIRSIAVDLRGAGRSDKPAAGYSMRDFSDDLAAFARSLGVSGFTMVGHSMGGTISYQFALDHADLLKAVVFVTPASADGIEAPTEDMFADQAKRKADNAYSIEVARKSRFFRPVGDWFFQQSARTLAESDDNYLRESWWGMTDFHEGDRLGEIQTPALMIGADHDESVPLSDVLADWKRIHGCGLYVFSRCNHWPPQEAPDEFARVLLDFLDGVNAGAATPAAAVAG